MIINFKTLLTKPHLLVSTGFGVGLIPFAPGTFGSGLGLGLYIVFAHFSIPNLIVLVVFISLLIISLFIVDRSLKEMGYQDHDEIVLDEILAMMLVAHFIPPDPRWAIAAFLIFRFFDIVKPFPIRRIERSYNNAFGTIVDDLIAAIYSIVLILILRFLLI